MYQQPDYHKQKGNTSVRSDSIEDYNLKFKNRKQ